MTFLLPYGVNADGQLVFIDAAPRGRAGLTCPYCGTPLLARKGDRLAPHFAHDGPTCRESRQHAECIALPAYTAFNLNLPNKILDKLRAYHDQPETHHAEDLEDYGLLKSYVSNYGRTRWELTHAGKIPLGTLSLDLFNRYQEARMHERLVDLETKLLESFGWPSWETHRMNLRLYRAQMRRVLEASLYFIEVSAATETLYKIGVTTRPLEQRLAEIAQDLAPHLGAVTLKPLGVWPHWGATEPYFKFRYRRFQRRIGALTEYFTFPNRQSVLRDLRRMKPKVLDSAETALLAGEVTQMEAGRLPPDKVLSRPAWTALNHLDDERLRGCWRLLRPLLEYRLPWQTGLTGCRLIEHVTMPGDQFRLTPFGQHYCAHFAPFYHELYGDIPDFSDLTSVY